MINGFAIPNFRSRGRSNNPQHPRNRYNSFDEREVYSRAYVNTLSQATDPSQDFQRNIELQTLMYYVQQYCIGNFSDQVLQGIINMMPQYSIPLLPDKEVYRGTTVPHEVMSHLEEIFHRNNLELNKEAAHRLMHPFLNTPNGIFLKPASVSTVPDIAAYFLNTRKSQCPSETPLWITIKPLPESPPRGIIPSINVLPTGMFPLNEHEVIMGSNVNQYSIENVEFDTQHNNYKITLRASSR